MKITVINNLQVPTFKTLEEFQNNIRNKGRVPDHVMINEYEVLKDVVFTMDNYDVPGEEINYSNKKYSQQLIVLTKGRYNTGFKDAVVVKENACGFRNDINYLQ
jgi:hypothetical protein